MAINIDFLFRGSGVVRPQTAKGLGGAVKFEQRVADHISFVISGQLEHNGEQVVTVCLIEIFPG